MTTDYIPPTETWWRIAYVYRPPRFVRDRSQAIRLAEETGAQFVQEHGGERKLVWRPAETRQPRRLTGADVRPEGPCDLSDVEATR